MVPAIYVFSQRCDTQVSIGVAPPTGTRSEVIDLRLFEGKDPDANPAWLVDAILAPGAAPMPSNSKGALEALLRIVWDKAHLAGHTAAVLEVARKKSA
jgi:hypothetical protein